MPVEGGQFDEFALMATLVGVVLHGQPAVQTGKRPCIHLFEFLPVGFKKTAGRLHAHAYLLGRHIAPVAVHEIMKIVSEMCLDGKGVVEIDDRIPYQVFLQSG